MLHSNQADTLRQSSKSNVKDSLQKAFGRKGGQTIGKRAFLASDTLPYLQATSSSPIGVIPGGTWCRPSGIVVRVFGGLRSIAGDTRMT